MLTGKKFVKNLTFEQEIGYSFQQLTSKTWVGIGNRELRLLADLS